MSGTRWLKRSFLAAVCMAGAVACGGGGDDDGGTNPPPVGGFTFSLSSSTLSVEQGSSGSVTATITRTGSFTGTVNLTTESVPTGITPAFNPAAITSGTTSTTLSVAVAATVAPGTYTFTVRGQASGLSDQTGVVTMTVTAKPAIAIALPTAAGSVVQGASLTYTANITRTNFTGAVAVAVTGAPTGVTTSVANTGGAYTVTVNTTGSAAPGNYTLTTTASGTGVTSVSANYTLTVTAPAASIALSASPTTVSVSAGLSGATTVTIARTNFTGDVSVSASGHPSGVGISYAPSPTPGNSVTVTFNVAASVTPGSYPVTLTGSGTGVANATTSVTLAVTPSASAIALSLSRPAFSIAQGGSDATGIVITRTSFTGQVNLAVSGLPAGFTATLGSASTLTNGTTLTISAAVSVSPGTYNYTVTGSGSGISNATVNGSVTVTVASGGNVTYTFCGTSAEIPIWFAAQNGGGSWTQVAPGSGNTYSFNITSTGGVAWVTQLGADNYSLSVFYGSAAELNSFALGECQTPVTKTVTGNVAGLTATDQAFVSFGGAAPTTAINFLQTNFTIQGAPDGARDLLGSRATVNLLSQSFDFNKVYLKRGLNPANNGSVGTVDFNHATDAFVPESRTVTVNGASVGETVGAFASFQTGNGASAALGFPISSGASSTFMAVPASRTIAGDLHFITGFASPASSTTISSRLAKLGGTVSSAAQVADLGTTGRFVGLFMRDAVNTTITLGANLTVPTVDIPSLSNNEIRPRAAWTTQSDYQSIWTADFVQATTSVLRSAGITATAAWLGSASTVDLRVPNFSSVSGWQSSWGIRQGLPVNWSTTATSFIIGNGVEIDGSTFRAATRTGTLTP